jgi:hypothetical protein
MKSAALALCLALIAPAAAVGQSAVPLREVRFSGPSAADELCACLLDLRRSAEAQGRLDFTAEVESAGPDGPLDLTARIWVGSAHAVGRINFTGHSGINDSTLRRAMTITSAICSTSGSCGAASRASTTSASSSRSRWRTSASRAATMASRRT